MQEILRDTAATGAATDSDLRLGTYRIQNLATTVVNSAAKSSYSHHWEPSFCLRDRRHLNTNLKNRNSEGLEKDF